MKYIKKFETGEWSKDVTWQFVKDNPGHDSEEASWLEFMWEKLKDIKFGLSDVNNFEILDIRGYDLNNGPYGLLKIFGTNYKIWNIMEDTFWIKDFPIDNTGDEEEGRLPGFQGDTFDISNMLSDIEEAGDVETYLNTKKYNI